MWDKENRAEPSRHGASCLEDASARCFYEGREQLRGRRDASGRVCQAAEVSDCFSEQFVFSVWSPSSRRRFLGWFPLKFKIRFPARWNKRCQDCRGADLFDTGNLIRAISVWFHEWQNGFHAT